MRHSQDTQAFTLIEIVIVLVLIAILAAVAIPHIHGMSERAEESTIRGTLNNVRSAISMWHSNSLAEGVDAWPPYAAFPENVLSTTLTENPGANAGADNNVSDASDAGNGDTMGELDGTNNGWQYDADTGLFWANSDNGPDASGT